MADENNIGGSVGLDITDFKANVAELNRQIKVIDSGFKAAAAGMDDWGKSEEGLNTRINSLNQITDLQKQKVNNLTEIYKKVAEQKGENSKAAQDLQVKINNETAALNKNLKELNDSVNALNNFGKESENTSKKIDVLGDTTENTKKSLSDLGGNIAKSAAVGVAAIGTAAVGAIAGIFKFTNDSAKAMNNFQAQTGTTADKMNEFKSVANDIYANNFGESVNDIAQSMATVNQVTKQTNDELKNTTQTAILMRDTFGFEVSESINAVNGLMKNFGITSEQAYILVAQGAQNGANKNGDLLDLLNEYGVQFGALGLSAEDFTNTLIAGASSGAFQIDKVGDAVKEFEIRSKDGSKTSSEGFAALGLDAQQMFSTFAKGGEDSKKAFQDVLNKLLEMKDPVAQNQAGVALFGTQFEDLGLRGIAALAGISGQADMSKDTLEQINNVKYNDMGSALEGIKRQLISNIATPVEEKLLPKINDMANSLTNIDVTPIVDGLGWIVDNANNIAAGAVAIGAGIATWNAVSTISSIVSWFGKWKTATEGMTAAQAALNVVQGASPVGIIITLIAALVAGIIYLWNTNEGFRNALINAWESIENIVVSVVTTVIDFVKNNWQQLLLFLANPMAGALALLYNLNPQFKAWVDNLWNTIVSTLKNLPDTIAGFFTNIYNSFISWGTNVINWVTTTIPKIIESIFKFYNELPGKIGYALGYALGVIIKFGADTVNWVITEVPKIIDNIIIFFSELPGKVANEFNYVINKIAEWGSSVITWITTEVPKIIENIVAFFSELPDKIGGFFSSVLSGILSWINDVITTAQTEIPKVISSILDFFSELPSDMFEIGENIVKGIWEGIKNMTGWMKNKVGEFADGVVKGMKDALGIHSPSRVMRDQVGAMIGAGMAVGIEDSTKEVNSAMSALNKQVIADGNVNIDTTIGKNYSAKNQISSSASSENATGIKEGQIVIPLYLNTDMIAKGTANINDVLQGKKVSFQGRMVGQ
jgi:phage-related minor tail protein